MSHSTAYQWQVLLQAMVTGLEAGLLCQLLRSLYRLWPRRWVETVLDLGFMLALFFLLRDLVDYGCDGVLRLWPLFGVGAGMALCRAGFGRVLRQVGGGMHVRSQVIASSVRLWYNKRTDRQRRR